MDEQLVNLIIENILTNRIFTEQERLYQLDILIDAFTDYQQYLLDQFKVPNLYKVISHEDFSIIYKNASKLIGLNIDTIYQIKQQLTESWNEVATKLYSIESESNKTVSMLNTLKLYNDIENIGVKLKLYDFSNGDIEDDVNNKYNIDINKHVITLPIENKILLNDKIKNISILPVSNGQVGNNIIPYRPFNSDLNAIIDNNELTIFEYELIDNTKDLYLYLNIEFKEEVILNRLDIIPVNFGTETWPEVITITYSSDNKTYSTVVSDTEFPFEMVLDINNNSNNNIINFKPIKCRYLTIGFKSSSYYQILDAYNNTHIRNAIGIKSIDFYTIEYGKDGQVNLSDIYDSSIIHQMLFNINSKLTEDNHNIYLEVTLNNEDDTYQIVPISDVGTEILYFNDQTVYNSITTEEPVTLIKPTLKISRTDIKTVTKNIIKKTQDISELPTNSPYYVYLNKAPINEDVSIYNPAYIGVGIGRKLLLGISDGSENQTFTFDISIKDGDEIIIVNGEIYNRIESLTQANSNDKVYMINYETKSIMFGDGTHGFIPEQDSEIYMLLKEDNLKVNSIDEFIDASFHYLPTINSEIGINQLEIYNVNDIKEKTINVYIDKKYFKLDDPLITEIISIQGYTLVQFINGIKEFTSLNQVSFDKYNNTLHFSNAPNANIDITYKYYDAYLIDNNFYSVDKNSVKIDRSAVTLYDSTEIYNFDKTINLLHESIIPKTITIGLNSDIELKEVEYIDGNTEFIPYQKVREQIPVGVKQFILQYNPILDLDIYFSDKEVFATETTQLVKSGDYKIDYDKIRSRTIVSTVSTTVGGYIEYYIPKVGFTDDVLIYSVDYDNGIIYFNKMLDEKVTIGYTYVNLIARYIAGNPISSDKYKVNLDSGTIEFTDYQFIEQMKNITIPLVIEYYVNEETTYTFENYDKYTSPIISEVIIKWI